MRVINFSCDDVEYEFLACRKPSKTSWKNFFVMAADKMEIVNDS